MSQTSPTPQPHPSSDAPSKKLLWIGRILSAVPALMLLVSGTMKLMKPPQLAEGFAHLGWPEHLATPLGVLEIACTVIYLIPKTATLGAILLTGYLGGAIATHVRIGEPFIAQSALGIVIWLGLFLREGRLRTVLPVRRQAL